jgi:hypothetical protein
MAPNDVRKGDLVCILYGCSVPVILRQKPQKPEQLRSKRQDDGNDNAEETKAQDSDELFWYEFIGECYVHGMMDGEAVEYQNRNDSKMKRRIFELR